MIEETASAMKPADSTATAFTAAGDHQTRFLLTDAGDGSPRDDFARNVKAGLSDKSKSLSCRFLYDREGSQLFEKICELPEYYVTRVETSILQEHAAEIAERFSKKIPSEGFHDVNVSTQADAARSSPGQITLVEMGSGSAAKTRILIAEFLRRYGNLRYVPIDISRSMLEESSVALLADFPELQIHAIAGEYRNALRRLDALPNGPKLFLWLGSNVGNLDRSEAAAFLRIVRQSMSPSDRLLMGVDLRKERAILENAYDDSAGITAQFSRNILARINRELGGHFDLETFQHQAVYNEQVGRIEIFLVSARAQRVPIDRLGLDVVFAPGEKIHTENSYKYSPSEIEQLTLASGLRVERQWIDSERRFSVNLLAPGA